MKIKNYFIVTFLFIIKKLNGLSSMIGEPRNVLIARVIIDLLKLEMNELFKNSHFVQLMQKKICIYLKNRQ